MPSQKTRWLAQKLERWEIYFKTIAAVLLSLVSVYLAFTANRIATTQAEVAQMDLEVSQSELEISHRELQLLEADYLPLLVARQKMDYESGACLLYVINMGGPLRDLQCEESVFLAVESGRGHYLTGRNNLLLPVTGIQYAPYALITHRQDAPYVVQPEGKGEEYVAIFVLWPEGGGRTFLDVSDDICSVVDTGPLPYLVAFVDVQYTDRLGAEHSTTLFSPGCFPLLDETHDLAPADGETYEDFLCSTWRPEDRNKIIVTPQQLCDWQNSESSQLDADDEPIWLGEENGDYVPSSFDINWITGKMVFRILHDYLSISSW